MHYSYHVHPIRQANPNDCWAACSAMLLGLHGQEGVETVKQRARAGGVRLGVFAPDAGAIEPASVPTLARALGLRIRDSRQEGLSPAVLNAVLGHGPAAAFGDINYPGRPTSNMHVLLFTGANGADANPTISLVDPYAGRTYRYSMDQFNNSLGNVDYFLFL